MSMGQLLQTDATGGLRSEPGSHDQYMYSVNNVFASTCWLSYLIKKIFFFLPCTATADGYPFSQSFRDPLPCSMCLSQGTEKVHKRNISQISQYMGECGSMDK